MACTTARTCATSCAPDARATEQGQHRVEALSRAVLLLERVERVRQRVAHRHAEGPQSESAEEHPGLVPGAHHRIGEVAAVEAHARVDDHAVDAT